MDDQVVGLRVKKLLADAEGLLAAADEVAKDMGKEIHSEREWMDRDVAKVEAEIKELKEADSKKEAESLAIEFLIGELEKELAEAKEALRKMYSARELLGVNITSLEEEKKRRKRMGEEKVTEIRRAWHGRRKRAREKVAKAMKLLKRAGKACPEREMAEGELQVWQEVVVNLWNLTAFADACLHSLAGDLRNHDE